MTRAIFILSEKEPLRVVLWKNRKDRRQELNANFPSINQAPWHRWNLPNSVAIVP
jgi:hypothetical protein